MNPEPGPIWFPHISPFAIALASVSIYNLSRYDICLSSVYVHIFCEFKFHVGKTHIFIFIYAMQIFVPSKDVICELN